MGQLFVLHGPPRSHREKPFSDNRGDTVPTQWNGLFHHGCEAEQKDVVRLSDPRPRRNMAKASGAPGASQIYRSRTDLM